MIRKYYLMRFLTNRFCNPGLSMIPFLHEQLVTKNIIVKQIGLKNES